MRWLERLRAFPPCRRFHLFGIAGSLAVVVGTITAMIPYAGAQGEPYSVLNHFISELGHAGVSRLAVVFNAGLIAGGALYVPFVLGLGAMLGGGWATAGTAAGLVAAVSVACVGLFPMNDFQPHIAAAMTFFRSGLAAILLFGVAIQRQPPGRRVIARGANIASLAAVLAYAVFLVWLWWNPVTSSALDMRLLAARPAFWAAAVLEWAVMAASIAWFLVVALCRRKEA